MQEEIYKIHKNELANLDVEHPKVMICLAGAPGSGKSHLAEHLEEKFAGVRLSNDRARRIIESLDPGMTVEQMQPIVQEYLAYFLDKIQAAPNGLLILDSAIDRKYKRVFEEADSHGYKRLVVDLDVPKEQLEATIKAEKANPKDFIAHLDQWLAEHEEFRRQVKPDVVQTHGSSYDEVDKRVDQLLKGGANEQSN